MKSKVGEFMLIIFLSFFIFCFIIRPLFGMAIGRLSYLGRWLVRHSAVLVSKYEDYGWDMEFGG